MQIQGAETMVNIRRRGVKATKRGKPNPEYARSTVDGMPTQERLAKAGKHYAVGDDRQGTRIYHFHDSTLDRLYARLVKDANRDEQDSMRCEYTALQKFKHHWVRAGKEVTIGSVDPNRIFTSDPARRQGMPMADSQMHHDRKWRAACSHMENVQHPPGWRIKGASYGDKMRIVVDNVVCSENSLEIAGWGIGYDSTFRAREAATNILRHAGRELAKFWGIG